MLCFKPKFFDFLLGGSEKKKRSLQNAVKDATQQDRNDFELKMRMYQRSVSEWERDRELAVRLVDGETDAIRDVITQLKSLSQTHLIGSSVQFEIEQATVHAMPNVHSDEIIPKTRLKQLASGKLSETKMPVGQINGLYQDYVASVALKVAGDLFQVLPVPEVYVTCLTEMLNTSTGHKEPTPILSVRFVRETFNQLNLKAIDPSDALANFHHSINFKVSKGFAPATPLLDITE